MAHDIDLRNPAVARLMGQEPGIVSPAAQQNQMTQIAGDMDSGLMSTTRLDMGKREVGILIRPKGSETMVSGVLTADVYVIPGEPVKVVIICPRCHHRSEINADQKAVDWNPTAPCPFPATLRSQLPPEDHGLAAMPGVLSVETFVCKWELEDRMQDANKDVHIISSNSRCRYKAVIERNVLREE